jgi:hypothetical protein
MRGDSYQLQGQGGGVVINDDEHAYGKFRSMLVLVSGDVSIEYANVVNAEGMPVATSLGVLDAGTVINGVFNIGYISGASSKAICYYE